MSNKIYESVKGFNPEMAAFDLSFDKKLSFNMGQLIPAYLQEIIPGDMFRVNAEIMGRFAPMLAPVMHRVNVFMHYFFVPSRLLQSDWEDFITGGDTGQSSAVLKTIVFTTQTAFNKGTISDYFGLPSVQGSAALSNPVTVNALPYRAYIKIWNDYYRDENLQAEIDISTMSGSGSTARTLATNIKLRAFEKDYFTSALPDAQKGDPTAIAVGGSIGITYSNPALVSGTAAGASVDKAIGNPGAAEVSGTPVTIENISALDVSTLEIDINDLRLAIRLQEWWERRARGGSRYTEVILSEFGVKSSDARLQRAEYLGGGMQPVVISEVLQTAESATTAQGNMAGHGIAVGGKNSFQARFEEHGYVMGILSVLPRTCYQQGIHRMFTRQSRYDFAWPAFAHLGEQEVLNKELYYNLVTPDNPNNTFGYQQRYAEYKYNFPQVCGDFRDQLSYWHLGRIFSAEPVLNEDFITCDPADVDRIFAAEVTEDHKLWFQIYFDIKAKRPLPYFGDPRL